MDIKLIVDVGRNLVLNQDCITLLRQVFMTQGDIYNVFLSFVSGGMPAATPTMASFAFTVSLNTITYFSSNSITASTTYAGYPLQFQVIASSSQLDSLLANIENINLNSTIRWNNGSGNVSISPFTCAMSASDAAPESTFVQTINGVSDNVTVTGTDPVAVTTTGNNINVGLNIPAGCAILLATVS